MVRLADDKNTVTYCSQRYKRRINGQYFQRWKLFCVDITWPFHWLFVSKYRLWRRTWWRHKRQLWKIHIYYHQYNLPHKSQSDCHIKIISHIISMKTNEKGSDLYPMEISIRKILAGSVFWTHNLPTWSSHPLAWGLWLPKHPLAVPILVATSHASGDLTGCSMQLGPQPTHPEHVNTVE